MSSKFEEITTKKQKTWYVPPSEFSELCTNPIRKIVDNIKKPTKTTKELIPLSLGDPTVFGNLKCPDLLINTMVQNIRSSEYNGYVHSAGTIHARKAIAKCFGSDKSPLTSDDVVIASGCSGALDIALTGLLNPGDNILLPLPGFPLYQVICDAHKIKCQFYHLLPEKNWEIDLRELESLIDLKTKAILINNPSNPCGSVFSKKHLQDILSIAQRHKLPIIADEIYEKMVFQGNTFYPIASLSENVPILTVGGLAKQYLVPGWRVGWILIHDRNNIFCDLRKGIFRLTQLILGANSIVQSIIPTILTPEPGSRNERCLIKFKTDYMSLLESNASFTIQRLTKISGLHIVIPQGAMYAMIKIQTEMFDDIDDDCDFTQKLLDEEAVFVLPGQCFGLKNFFRIVFTAPHEKLQQAYDRIESFCQHHRKKELP